MEHFKSSKPLIYSTILCSSSCKPIFLNYHRWSSTSDSLFSTLGLGNEIKIHHKGHKVCVYVCVCVFVCACVCIFTYILHDLHSTFIGCCNENNPCCQGNDMAYRNGSTAIGCLFPWTPVCVAHQGVNPDTILRLTIITTRN